MRVELSGIKFKFPNECPCCGGTPDSELLISASRSKGSRVVRTEVRAWNLPYCSRCVKHVGDVERARGQLKLLVLLSILLATFIAFKINPLLGVGIGIAALLGASIVYKRQLDRLSSGCSSASCASIERTVDYLGWHGTLHQFEIRSVRFARNFMESNSGKLVNVSPEARNLLSASDETSRPNAPRSASRFIS